MIASSRPKGFNAIVKENPVKAYIIYLATSPSHGQFWEVPPKSNQIATVLLLAKGFFSHFVH